MITKTIAESVNLALGSIADASRAVKSDTSMGGVLMGDLAVSPIMTAFDNAALFVNEGVQHLSGAQAQGKLGAALLEHPTFIRDLSADASTLTDLADRSSEIRSAVSQPSGLREQTRAEVANTLQPITDHLMQLQKWIA